MTDFTFGSLFSGIGGLDLGLERAGMQCVWQSEIDPYASRVLKKHWPDIPNLGDIRDIDWTAIPRVDLVAGGYPCQPFSHAGKRQGDNDPRHLWPMFAECLRVLRPRFALLENVAGHLSLGFGDVQADLAALGYDAQWDCIPAAAVGAPHLRDRIFVIATRSDMGDTDNARSRAPEHDSKRTWSSSNQIKQWPKPFGRISGSSSIMADSDSAFSKRERQSIGRQAQHTNADIPSNVANPDLRQTRRGNGSSEPYQSETRSRRDHRGRDEIHASWEWWQTEPDVGRVADGIPNRLDRLKGLGNAVVPQVAEHMGRIIMDMQ